MYHVVGKKMKGGIPHEVSLLLIYYFRSGSDLEIFIALRDFMMICQVWGNGPLLSSANIYLSKCHLLAKHRAWEHAGDLDSRLHAITLLMSGVHMLQSPGRTIHDRPLSLSDQRAESRVLEHPYLSKIVKGR